MYFAIPIIILSAVSGTSNYGINNVFPNFTYGNIIIGTMSLIVAIISFINTFLRNAELSEEHRIAVIQWSKYSRTINTQISIKRNDRTEINDFLLICKTEMDRLMEQSPFIPRKIIIQFKQNFKDLQFELPSELDIINPTIIYKEKNDFLPEKIKENSPNDDQNNYSIIIFDEEKTNNITNNTPNNNNLEMIDKPLNEKSNN